ncbi:MAG: biopolymer transporter ExbD [Pseudomonadota bacterium]
MPRKTRRQARDQDTDINLTPMLDIVFIMLIFFIVSTSFVRETGIDPTRPFAATAQYVPGANVLIGLSASGVVWMEGEAVDLATMQGRVEAVRLRNPASSVVIVADETAPAGALQQVLNNVRGAGIERVSVAARPPGS